MRNTLPSQEELRQIILENPQLVLQDERIMRGLFGLPAQHGENLIDLNARAATAMGEHIAQLDLAAQEALDLAHDNHASMRLIHKAALHVLDAQDFAPYLDQLGAPLAKLLSLAATRLIIETPDIVHWPRLPHSSDVLITVPEGFCEAYLGGAPHQTVHMRKIGRGIAEIYGNLSSLIRSETVIDLNPAGFEGPRLLFTLASEDPDQFDPEYGTELLAFFAQVLSRSLRRWLL